MLRTPVRRSLSALFVVGVLAAGLVGCGSDSDSSSSAEATPTASASSTESTGCADVAALQDSLSSLQEVDLQQDGVAGLTAAITSMKAALETAKSSVSAALQPQVEAVTTAFDELETATAGLSDGNVREQVPAIAAALAQVSTSMVALSTAVTQSCPDN